MGEFFSLAGVIGASSNEVVEGLKAYAGSRGGNLTPKQADIAEDGILLVGDSRAGTVVMYPSDFLEWDDATAFLSANLKSPTFSFHIHDGDLWMFILFVDGRMAARFNPLPDYWDEEISEEERVSWKGDAAIVAGHVPGLRPADIDRYFVSWELETDEPGKAYPDDRFPKEDCWQLVDFMRRLGFSYPIDDAGRAHGKTYELRVKN